MTHLPVDKTVDESVDSGLVVSYHNDMANVTAVTVNVHGSSRPTKNPLARSTMARFAPRAAPREAKTPRFSWFHHGALRAKGRAVKHPTDQERGLLRPFLEVLGRFPLARSVSLRGRAKGIEHLKPAKSRRFHMARQHPKSNTTVRQLVPNTIQYVDNYSRTATRKTAT